MNDTKTGPAFQPGDVVILKSGGPAMTVLHVHGAASDVAWFTSSDFSDDDLVTRTFPNACLERLPDFGGEDGDGERSAQVVDIAWPANSDTGIPEDPQRKVA